MYALITEMYTFQSTLPRGERLFNITNSAMKAGGFNPRSHAGSDNSAARLRCWCARFNPRSHAGSDPVSLAPTMIAGVFQSTLPRGERPL